MPTKVKRNIKPIEPGAANLEVDTGRKAVEDLLSSDLHAFLEQAEENMDPQQEKISIRAKQIRDELIDRLIHGQEGIKAQLLDEALQRRGLSLADYDRLLRITFTPKTEMAKRLRGQTPNPDVEAVTATARLDAMYSLVAEIKGEVDGQLKKISPYFERVVHSYAYYRASTEVKMIAMEEEGAKDTVTGFVKSPDFYSKLYDIELRRLETAEGKCMLIIEIDLDDFKIENDAPGSSHPRVDREILKPVAEALNHVLRPSDIKCRMGGDEITLILNEVDPNKIDVIIERIQTAIKSIKRISDPNKSLTGTVGFFIITQNETHDAPSALQARERADNASQIAKGKKMGSNLRWTESLPPIEKDLDYYIRKTRSALSRDYGRDVDFLGEELLQRIAQAMIDQDKHVEIASK